MNYQIADQGSAMTVTVSGDWAFHDHNDFRVMLRTMRESDAMQFTVDCEGLQSMEAAGLGMLSMIQDMAQAKGADLNFTGVHGEVASVLTTAKFDRHMPLQMP